MTPPSDSVLEENEDSRRLLEEAIDAVRAISAGEVDAVVVGSQRVYTLDPAEKHYRILVERMTQPAATLTCEGEIISCNRRFEDLLGQGSQALIGRSFHTFLAPESRPRLERLLLAGQTGDAEENMEVLRSDGLVLPVCLGASDVREGAYGQCLLVADRSEQRHFQELQQAQEALHEADRKKDEFLATLAHELRNPLAPIRHALEILKSKNLGESELQWSRAVIDRQVQHMARLLEDLLDVSRIGRNQLELRKAPIALSDILEAAVETSRPVLEAAGHQLIIRIQEGDALLEADPVRLAQVFSNLLNNAAQYTDRGGEVRLTAERAENEVIVSIQDNGTGIRAEDLSEIFTIFSQVKTETRRVAGLGIGLSLARGLVELHGGSIAAHSDGPGHGSVFIVRLPILLESRVLPFEDGHAENPDRKVEARRILVVDDYPDSADSLSILLRMMGHEVVTAYDGKEAMEVADALRPQTVIVDIQMPKAGGHEVCRHIREREWGRDVLMIAMSGWGQANDHHISRQAGFDHHLVKPADPAVLKNLLSS